MKRIKLKWKIFAFLLGFCALLLGVLWLFQTVLLTDMYKAIRSQELRKAIAEVEREIDSPNLLDVLTRIKNENDIDVSLTQDFTMPYYAEYEYHGRDGRVRSYRNNIQEFITEVREFELEEGYIISLTFHARIAPVDATVSTLKQQLYFITVVMIVLSVLLAIIIAKRVSKPIEEINKGALNLSRGDYDVRFDSKGFREIVELSDTLNTAAVELGRVESLRRELLANVSHDMRTPLTLIYSYSEMMSDFPDEITAEQVKVIMDETRRLTTLVNDVLDVSKLESDMVKNINKSRFNLTQSISDTVNRMQKLLKSDEFNITFATQTDYDVFISADETKINRAFYNLLINAVNYSGDEREIIVTQSVIGNRVRISVADKGEGIAQNELQLIWDRYYKSGKAHKRAVTGTGLGLSIVKKIIELHNGCYGVDSTVGVGSRFWFELKV